VRKTTLSCSVYWQRRDGEEKENVVEGIGLCFVQPEKREREREGTSLEREREREGTSLEMTSSFFWSSPCIFEAPCKPVRLEMPAL
jgi:hypothetical protein